MSFLSFSAPRRFASTAAAALLLGSLAAPTLAQNGADLSCRELWYARAAIYARNGYCFRTARARAVFGPGCFPPFGTMSAWDGARVQLLDYWWQRKHC
jgi:hypothetical protein